MASIDIFNNKAFEMTALTDMVNKMPYVPNRLQSLNLAPTQGIRTESVAIEKKEGKLALIQSSERGEPLVQGTPTKRDIRDFRTIRLAKGDTITASEIQGIRAYGSETELKQVQGEVAERTAQLIQDMNLTIENMLLGMVQGIVVDADDTVINNWFDEWGITQATEVTWDFTTGTLTTFRQYIHDLRRRMQRNAQGLPWGGAIHALVGDTFYDNLTTHPELEKTYLNQTAASELRADSIGQVFSTFTFAGVTFENYRGTDDNSTVAIAAGEAKFYPAGARGVFFDKRAPGESFSAVNQKGKSLYSLIVPDRDRDMWVKPEIYSYPLFGCLRPEMLERAVSD